MLHLSREMGLHRVVDLGECVWQTRVMHREVCTTLQELALAERRSLLEAVWQSREGPSGDAVYSRDALLGSMDLDWQDVQWAVNIVRSRCMIFTSGGHASAGVSWHDSDQHRPHAKS